MLYFFFPVHSGADKNLPDFNGMSPLIIASFEGHLSCVESLISLQARMDLADRDDRSALFHAAMRDHVSVVKSILGIYEYNIF